jgi:hypothetical protein
VGNLIGAGYGLTKTGAGTLAIGSGTVSRITGVLNVAGGKVQIAQGTTTGTANDLVVGGLAGSGTIETGNVVSRWLFVQNTADNLFSGTLQDGGGAFGLSKAGTGTLTLTGTNTYTSQDDGCWWHSRIWIVKYAGHYSNAVDGRRDRAGFQSR